MSDKIRRRSDNHRQPAKRHDYSDDQSVPRVLTALARNEATGCYVAPHSHPRGQLLYATSGLMRAATDAGIWLLPPQRGLWIPAGVVHDQRMLSPTTMRTIYIEPVTAVRLGDTCRTIEISSLLRELILALLAEPAEYSLNAKNEHIVALVLLELEAARTINLEIPWPKDRRILMMCEAILAAPDTPMSLDYWAEKVGGSSRTLIRLFIKETGLTFRHWVQQVRLAEALNRLEKGEPVANVAYALGFASPSAFAAMFRKTMGQSPTDYLVDRAMK
ncbi:AraC family transcriptional regulator [Paraburkholderia nodosa]|uniref:AraC family transcriptional regulator n=1 Tax=Paraburkholderia nodosa TaxID=392320 RepID=UPI000487AAAB|nr:helix-turn-helix transcriptional regulator [Paraburkholderia nodosa]